MMIFKRIIIIFCLVLFSLKLPVSAEVGDTAAQFLNIGVGARPIAMGGAYAALADDVYSIYWNPGGLSIIENNEISMMYNKWISEITHGYLGFIHPLKDEKGAIGAAVTYLYTGNIDRTHIDADGDIVTTSETFMASDMLVNLSYGKKIKSVNTGLNVKYISQKIDDETATAFAVDIGALHETGIENFTIGAAIQNLGSSVKFISEADPLPLNIKFGGAYKLLDDNKLTLALDLNYPLQGKFNIRFGSEYKIIEIASVRLGYNTVSTNGLGAMSGLSAGCGFFLKDMYSLDYAWVPYGDLGATHRISLSYRFGKSEKPRIKKESKKEVKKIKASVSEKKPEKPVIKKNLKAKYFGDGHRLFTEKKYEESIKEFEKVLQIDPNHPQSKSYIERARKALENK